MGAACVCQSHDTLTEVVISVDDDKYLASQNLQSRHSNTEVVKIEFALLSNFNPALALSLSFQSLCQGFLHRKSWNKKKLAGSLQGISRSFLARRYLDKPKKGQKFEKYSVSSQKISDFTSLNFSDFDEKTQKKINKALEKELIVISKDKYYQGDWDENEGENGFGIEVNKACSTYIGEFIKGKKSGKGWIFFSNQDSYSGHFFNDKINGEGKFKFSDGRTLTGNFENGQVSGEAQEIWENGSMYSGSFNNLKKHGKGKLVIPKISTYTGDFKEDEFEGFGILELENGCKYEGEWLQGLKHGKGKFSWPNGKEYKGEFLKDKKHGRGIMKYPSKVVYNGEWVNDLQHGKAIYTYFDKSKGRMRSHNSLWDSGTKITFLTKSGDFYTARSMDLYSTGSADLAR